MIVVNPPAVMPYAPATQPIAYVDVFEQRQEGSNRLNIMFMCLDANKNRIAIDQAHVPVPQVSAAQLATFVSTPAVAGDTFDQSISRRALPIVVTNLGLTNAAVQ
jgi:hypothetical protein